MSQEIHSCFASHVLLRGLLFWLQIYLLLRWERTFLVLLLTWPPCKVSWNHNNKIIPCKWSLKWGGTLSAHITAMKEQVVRLIYNTRQDSRPCVVCQFFSIHSSFAWSRVKLKSFCWYFVVSHWAHTFIPVLVVCRKKVKLVTTKHCHYFFFKLIFAMLVSSVTRKNVNNKFLCQASLMSSYTSVWQTLR